MELFRKGRLLSNILQTSFNVHKIPISPIVNSPVRYYAARRGTRMKADKKKVKVEIQKLGFIPHSLRVKSGGSSSVFESKRIKEEWKQISSDNVWIAKYYRWRLYSFSEAVQCHRETHHPMIFNKPNAKLEVFLELDMTIKTNKFVEKFTRTAMIPYGFDHGEDRTILVFCKSAEDKETATNAGATLVGGTEIIRDIEKGKIVLPDFNVVLAHPDIFKEMITIRGLLKKRFPNPKFGTVGADLQTLVTKFKRGVTYTAVRDEKELDYGWINVAIGTLDMDINHLEENFKELINDVMTQAPQKVERPFITRIMLKSAPSAEQLKLDLSPYIKQEELKSDSDSEDEDEPVKLEMRP